MSRQPRLGERVVRDYDGSSDFATRVLAELDAFMAGTGPTYPVIHWWTLMRLIADLERRSRLLEAVALAHKRRLDTLDEQITALQAAVTDLTARVEALETGP